MIRESSVRLAGTRKTPQRDGKRRRRRRHRQALRMRQKTKNKKKTTTQVLHLRWVRQLDKDYVRLFLASTVGFTRNHVKLEDTWSAGDRPDWLSRTTSLFFFFLPGFLTNERQRRLQLCSFQHDFSDLITSRKYVNADSFNGWMTSRKHRIPIKTALYGFPSIWAIWFVFCFFF